ncbi:MAG TPA: MFS transporter, partial [Actinomycetota bacterium]|nr:MFS transporter [Actinomycetota bacterium]
MAQPSRSRRTLALSVGALFVSQLLVAVVPLGVGAVAPFLRTEFGLQRSQVGLASATIFVAVAMCSIPAGRVADSVRVPAALLASTTIVAVGTVGLGSARAVAMLAVSLLVVGVGYSLISPATNKGVIALTPPRLRGRLMGVKQTGVTIGGALAAAALPFGVQRVGFSGTLFIAAAVIGVVGAAAAAAVRRLVASPASDGEPAATDRRRAISPRLRRRVLTLGAATAGMVAAQHVVATYLTLFLVDRRSMTAAAAAGLLTVLHLSGTVARVGWGWVSDRIGSRLATMALIGSVSIASLLALATFGDVMPAWVLVGLVIVLGTATQGGNAVYQVAIAEEDVERAGWASGVGMALGFSGAIVAP